MADTNNNILREIWGKLCTITDLLQNPTTTPSIDPEVVCLSNDGGTTIVTGVVVYDISVNPPTETIYLNGTDVTGTYVKVPCEKNLDFETKETCYQDITDPSTKYTRIDWFEKDNLVVPVSTVWFDVTAGTYSATAPLNIQPCSDTRQVLADHNNGCIERTVPQNVCNVTNSVFTLLDTDLTTFTITVNDGNGNFTGVQDFSNPAAVPTFINMMTLLSSSGARTTEDIANGALILNFWEQNISNIVQTGPTQVQYDIHLEAGVTDTPTPLTAPCVDPVADSAYQSSAATLKSIFDGYVLGVPVPNGGDVIVFTVSVYAPAVTTTVTHIPAKQVVTYDVNGNPVSDLYYEQGTLAPIVFDPLTDVFKNVCTQQPISVDIVSPAPVVAPIEVPNGAIIINSASMSVIVGGDLVRSFSVKGLDNVKYNISFDNGTSWLTDIDGGDSWGEGNSDNLDISQVFVSPSVNGDRVFIHWETI